MNIVINDFIDLGVLGERPCVICGAVTMYGQNAFVDLIAVDVDGVNMLKFIEQDAELRDDYRQMLIDEANDIGRGVAELVAAREGVAA